LIGGQGAKKSVDREVGISRLRDLEPLQRAMANRQVIVGWGNIDHVLFDPHASIGFDDAHVGVFSEEIWQETGAVGRLMRHHDKGHATVGRHVRA
jgi:hypothetical protein